MEGQEPRLCRCGCGTPLKSARSEFAPGHHMRLVPRSTPGSGRRRGALPLRDRPLCACGCGERVLNPGARFLPGHWQRTPDWRDKVLGPSTSSVRTCPECGRSCVVPRDKDKTWKACSRECVAASLRTAKPRNRLQQRCFEYMKAQHLTMAAFARLAEINGGTLRSWVTHKGSTTSRENLAKLARTLGIPEDQAVEEAGGITAEQHVSAVSRRSAETGAWRILHTPEVRSRQAASQRGKPKHTEETKDAIRRALRESGAAARASAQLEAWHKRPVGRLTQHLWTFLRLHPEPSQEQIEERMTSVAKQTKQPRELVKAAWKPYLLKKGLWDEHGGGPKLLERRHRTVEEYMAERGLAPEQRKPRGFWEEAAARVGKADPADIIDGPALKAWYSSHRLRCPKSYLKASAAA